MKKKQWTTHLFVYFKIWKLCLMILTFPGCWKEKLRSSLKPKKSETVLSLTRGFKICHGADGNWDYGLEIVW